MSLFHRPSDLEIDENDYSVKMVVDHWWWIRWAYLYPILGLLRYHPLGDRKVCCGFPDDLPCMRGQPALLSDAKCFYQDPIPNCAHYYLSMNSIQPKLDIITHFRRVDSNLSCWRFFSCNTNTCMSSSLIWNPFDLPHVDSTSITDLSSYRISGLRNWSPVQCQMITF